MKKSLLLTVILILSMMVLFGCAKEEAQVPPTTPETNQEETPADEGDTEGKPLAGQNLKVAMSANYKYFETVVVDASGKETYEGLDIDILDKLSENLGFTYEIMNMPFASLIGSLQSNQADFVISGMSYTEERAQSVDFSDKYAVAKIGVLLNEDSDMSSAADLKGKKVACSAGTNFENIIKSIRCFNKLRSFYMKKKIIYYALLLTVFCVYMFFAMQYLVGYDWFIMTSISLIVAVMSNKIISLIVYGKANNISR